ncbi:thiol reductant ABC exporter subunit CydC [Acetobacter conturbans]|uniref:Thiol reductant ABC exporter subunit CydC n=1 Tax=Acetobacter conturbans TaxID=1737472 RepID=A0ABX0JUS7_9PROT|nr:thiol reductant ABC exporter subunit CydC [Acetobacter conturbans]NHN87248.1 thiol reductant ABC exporter subunit CydC [Acetobacter conturbans]
MTASAPRDLTARNPAPRDTAPRDSAARERADRDALIRIVEVWRPHAARLIVGLLLSLLAVLAGLALMSSAGLRFAGAALGMVLVTTTALRVLGLSRIGLRYAERLYAHDAMFRALATLRVWFFRSLAKGAAAGLGFRRAGDLLSRLVSDVETLDGLYLRLLLPLAGACLTFPVLMIVVMNVNGLLGVLIGILFAASALILPLAAARLSRKEGGGLNHAQASLRVDVLDLVSGMREIRAFGAGSRVLDHVNAANGRLLARQAQLSRRMAFVGALSQLCTQTALLLMLAAIAGVGFDRIPAVQGVGLMFLTLAAFEGVSGLTRAGMLAGNMGAAARRIVAIADEHPQPSLPVPSPANVMPTVFDIHFEHVGFRWRPDRPAVFEDFSLDIAAGSRIALLGPSGAGKSTLAALLLKATFPQSGRVLLGGQDIASLPDTWLRRHIAWLSQATHLFDDTIRNNLLLGAPEASEEALWKALDEAAIGDFIRKLPEGLDTWLGEAGVKVSGGQGRRIALARTLLSDAPILVLDEPATGLDAQTEQDFFLTLNRVAQGRTVILIAHRLTGVEQLDHAWRLSGGHAVPFSAQG